MNLVGNKEEYYVEDEPKQVAPEPVIDLSEGALHPDTPIREPISLVVDECRDPELDSHGGDEKSEYDSQQLQQFGINLKAKCISTHRRESSL